MSDTRPKYVARRSAFSLLEVILAMALSAIVVYLIAGAIDFHLRQLTVRRSRIEEAQLARAILRRIADDLRAVVVDRPVDFSSVSQLASSAVSAAAGASQDDAGGEDGDSGGTDDTNITEESTELADTSLLPKMPGVYGNTYELQVDISRIPRYEEYALIQQTGQLGQLRLVSDVKTVSYFVLGQQAYGLSSMSSLAGGGSLGLGSNSYAASFGGVNDPRMMGLPPGQPLQGLGRRVVDRAATRYAMENGDYGLLDLQTELFAPEVLLVQFRYFDGQQWLAEWNTEQFGGVPLAVEIVLVLQTAAEESITAPAAQLNPSSTQAALWQYDQDHVYRLVVNIPAAELIDTTASTDASTDSTTTPDAGGGAT